MVEDEITQYDIEKLFSTSVSGEEIGIKLLLEWGLDKIPPTLFKKIIDNLCVTMVVSENQNLDRKVANLLYIIKDTDLADDCVCSQDVMDYFDMMMTKSETSPYQRNVSITPFKLREMLTKIFKWKQKKLNCVVDMESISKYMN